MALLHLLARWQVWAIPFGLALCKEMLKCIVWRAERAEMLASVARGGVDLCWVGIAILLMAFADPLSNVSVACGNAPLLAAVITIVFIMLSALSIAFHKASKPSTLQADQSLTLAEAPPRTLPSLPKVVYAVVARLLLFWQLTKPAILTLLSWGFGLYMAAQAVALAMPSQAH